MANARGGKEAVNAVHQDAILNETIKKERRIYQPYSNFSINPFRPINVVTGKPNSMSDSDGPSDKDEGDELMKRLIQLAHKPPTEKHAYPQTSSQEYGWMTKPLLEVDRNDSRLHHPKKLTDITRPKEAEWKLMEQTKNLST